MPSNFTPNYNLNQWEADDRVLRTDFNADNAKLDAALKAVDKRADALNSGKADKSALTALQNTVSAVSARAGSEVLGSTTLTEDGASVYLPLTNVDWSRYSALVVYLSPKGNAVFYTPFRNLRTSGLTLTVVFPMRSSETKITGFHSYGSSSIAPVLEDRTFKDVTGVSYAAINGTFEAGSTARAVGIH